MSEQRRDNRGRKLRNGEMQMKDGRYRYKYVDFLGEAHVVYSWKLERHDSIPDGKKNSPSLRELERQIQADMFDRVAVNGGNVTVLEKETDIPAHKIGKQWKFKMSELDEWIKSGKSAM